ncbi:MAG: hypothetical protein LC739_04320 [Actinobacteria bacterium]|nr:hypothetical protein [Actinomycetota bacterium]
MNGQTGRADRLRGADLVFVIGLALYAFGCLLILGQGLLAVAASASAELHESLHVQGLGTGFLDRVALRAADASHSVPSVPQIIGDYVFSLVHLGLAAILLRLRPRDWTARLLATALVGAAGVFNLTSQAVLEQLPFTGFEDLAQVAAHVVAGLSYLYALLLFPDGRPVPRWRRPALISLYLTATLGAIFLSIRLEGPARPATLLLFFGLLVPAAGVAAQVYRILNSGSVTGQAQARLLLWVLLPSVGFGVIFLVLHGLSPATNVLAGRDLAEPPLALYRSFQPAFAIIPLGLFAGILRYRLWDIERLLNRTTVYAIATGFLGGLYVAFVVVAQLVLGTVAASPLIDSKAAVAVTTLLFVSAFRPVRDRVQTVIDRRFNRSRYDAQVTVERFTEGLRDEVDLQGIVGRLNNVLNQVIEPRHVSVWLNDVPFRRAPKVGTGAGRNF